jgi:hypothetical protein
VRYSRSGMKNEWAEAMCETFSSIDPKAGTEQKRHWKGDMRERREAIRSSIVWFFDGSCSPGRCTSGAGCGEGALGAGGISETFLPGSVDRPV